MCAATVQLGVIDPLLERLVLLHAQHALLEHTLVRDRDHVPLALQASTPVLELEDAQIALLEDTAPRTGAEAALCVLPVSTRAALLLLAVSHVLPADTSPIVDLLLTIRALLVHTLRALPAVAFLAQQDRSKHTLRKAPVTTVELALIAQVQVEQFAPLFLLAIIRVARVRLAILYVQRGIAVLRNPLVPRAVLLVHTLLPGLVHALHVLQAGGPEFDMVLVRIALRDIIQMLEQVPAFTVAQARMLRGKVTARVLPVLPVRTVETVLAHVRTVHQVHTRMQMLVAAQPVPPADTRLTLRVLL